MPGRTERRVGANGTSQSRYVVLPKVWCEGTGIRKGTDVELLFDGILVVVPPGMKEVADRVLATLHGGGRR